MPECTPLPPGVETMDTSNNDAHTTTFGQDLIVLGIASLDTQGGPLAGEEMGGSTTLGISQD
ncbi:hypothetical protein XPR_0272 [Xanthomonas arboricola pv. pruni MAFF 301420]|uniref:Uncharacterized protein n=7 Tax=Xanthomonas arboricola TaxID=56448 RepID=W4SB60_9XANT|nr:3-deoxy-D-manno-octulosonic-acid transferase [Xanthomonas arboricola pv. pruni str. MAFF 311562]GAE53637.1 hypothetical protein XPR_0272 [Xanthomonas arboricola pv. pruni MAFF 301420]